MPKTFTRGSAQTVAVLSICQLVGWGTSFDMLGVMGRIVAPDLGLSNEIVFSGLTVMMVVTGLASPITGRLLARHGAARVLAASSIAFALGFLLLAASTGLVLYGLAWIVIGIGGAMGLSAPAYAAVVEREGQNGKRVIAIMMLFTGLSTTLFWPVLAMMNAEVGWRGTYLVCAGLHLFVCLPLYLFALPKRIAAASSEPGHATAPIPLTAAGRRKAFLLIAAATTISTFVTFGLAPSLLEIFRQYGASPALALQLGSVRGVIGISARLVDTLLGRRGSPILSALVGIGLMVAGFLSLLCFGGSTAQLVVFTLLFGFGAGVMAVARALLPLALFSRSEYGLHSARLSLPQNLANAVAPVVFTAILDHANATAALAVCALLAMAALALVAMLGLLVRRA
ncbi:MAG: MFS transporter, partial [Rhizobium sp.]